MIKDKRLLFLLDKIIGYAVPRSTIGKGIPIGNLTSQYFANLYLGELDYFIKEQFRGHLRYMDDWIVLSDDQEVLSLPLHRPVERWFWQRF